MGRISSVLLAAVSAVALSAFDSNSNSDKLKEQAAAAQDLARGFDRDESRGDLFDAESAAARGDWIVSAALAEQSYKEHPDVIN